MSAQDLCGEGMFPFSVYRFINTFVSVGMFVVAGEAYLYIAKVIFKTHLHNMY